MQRAGGETGLIGDWTFYLYAIPSVILMGLAKGGFSGLGLLSMALLSLAVSPVKAAALMLPILIVQDIVTIWAYRKTFDKRNLWLMLPGAMLGVLAGWYFAASVNEAAVRLMVGLIALGFVAWMLLRRLQGAAKAATPVNPGIASGIVWGAAGGFTSFVAHAGGPPFQVYVMPQRLPAQVYVGTNVVFFTVVNFAKLGPYILMGQFSGDVLPTSAVLLPAAVAATLAGVWIVRRIRTERFYVIVTGLTFLLGLKLTWDGTLALIG